LAGNCSELDDGKTGDSREIAEVQRRHLAADMQRCRTNQQILKRKLDVPENVFLAKILSCMKAFEISDFQEDEIDVTRTRRIRMQQCYMPSWLVK
jgi:hypothetical protein